MQSIDESAVITKIDNTTEEDQMTEVYDPYQYRNVAQPTR